MWGILDVFRELSETARDDADIALAATQRSPFCLEYASVACRDDKPVAGYRRFFTADPFGNRLEFMQKV